MAGIAGAVAGGTGAVAGCESLIGFSLGVMFVTEFLQEQEGAGAFECVGWEFGGDDGFEVLVARIEATEKV